MRGSTLRMRNMDQADSSGQMVESTMESGRMARCGDWAGIPIPMASVGKVNG